MNVLRVRSLGRRGEHRAARDQAPCVTPVHLSAHAVAECR
jgi:hypothetical protein